MTHFIQIHALTAYPPSNLNRDDLGRPKTAFMGGCERLRISSQSLKRAWRESEFFEGALGQHLGTRTKRLGCDLYKKLTDASIDEKEASDWLRNLLKEFGKLEEEKTKSEKSPLKHLEFSQLVHISPLELSRIEELVEKYSDSKQQPEIKDLKEKKHKSVDIAAFGRMLAEHTDHNMEAAIQVAHAITTHAVKIEDDFFTAVDDLNAGASHSGSAHIGEIEFGSGLFYLYVCIDRALLKKNLEGDEDLTQATIAALIESIAKVSPKGKQNTFGSRARASYMLVEKGDEQPRSLAAAFFKEVKQSDIIAESVKALESCRDSMNAVYEEKPCSFTLNQARGQGLFSEMINFAKTE